MEREGLDAELNRGKLWIYPCSGYRRIYIYIYIYNALGLKSLACFQHFSENRTHIVAVPFRMKPLYFNKMVVLSSAGNLREDIASLMASKLDFLQVHWNSRRLRS